MANRGGAAQGWHREDIKAALRKQYGHITALSVAWGYNRAAITHALGSRRKSSAALERRIAAAIGVTPQTLWPDRWTPEGLRRPQSVIRSKASRPRLLPHRQKRAAA